MKTNDKFINENMDKDEFNRTVVQLVYKALNGYDMRTLVKPETIQMLSEHHDIVHGDYEEASYRYFELD